MFETYSDEQLLVQVRRTADQCVAVMAMPVEQRRVAGEKGKVSPEQAGTVSAMFTILALKECERRGLA